MYCTLWEECKQTQCSHRSWRERTKTLMWYYSPTKNKLKYQVRANAYDFWLSDQYGKYNRNIFLFHPLGPFPQKWCTVPEFFVLISSHCSTQIWRMRIGGSCSIYFLVPARHLSDDLQYDFQNGNNSLKNITHTDIYIYIYECYNLQCSLIIYVCI